MSRFNHLFSTAVQPANHATLYRLGLIYAGYRLALAFFLIALFLVTLNNPLIGVSAPYLYLNVLAFYSFFSLLSYVLLRHWTIQLDNQLSVMLIFDIVALALMSYTNGGPNLQMSMLYLVVVMAANILLPAGRAIVVALFAALMVIYQQFFYSILQQADMRSIGGAALLALSFIGISVIGQVVIRRLRMVEQLAQYRFDEIHQLQQLSEKIVEQLATGLLVLDASQNIVLINKAAKQLVFPNGLLTHQLMGQPLVKINPALSLHIQNHLQQQQHEFLFKTPLDQVEINVQLTSLVHADYRVHTLVMLQSLQHLNQQVQQLKLASLGQLTASIAHEIRNPLAAISQASELMSEGALETTERELLALIQRQTRRLNVIIENILHMSRRKSIQPQAIQLQAWLSNLIDDNLTQVRPFIALQIQPDLSVWFDPLQLQHILINLLQNAVHHSKKLQDNPVIRVLASQHQAQVTLDVMDSGPGISDTVLQSLFEPFFTTEPQGTGLGLYLSKAFCEANNAQLLYIPQTRGACFRIVFGLAPTFYSPHS